jgi:hypothetical protein
VVLIAMHSPSYFDRLAMDPLRDAAVRRIRAADRHGRLRVLVPVASDGHPTIVHSKVTVIDGRVLRVGSANLADRSMGFDTECDLAIEADPADMRTRRAVMAVCHRLWADHLGTDAATVAAAFERSGGLVGAFDALAGAEGRGVRPVPEVRSPLLEGMMDAVPVVDPSHPAPARRLASALRWGAIAGGVGAAAWWWTRRQRTGASADAVQPGGRAP